MGKLELLPQYQVLVLGAGNILRSDDGVGSMVISLLRDTKKWPESICILEVGTAMFYYLHEISCSRCVIIIDAVRAGGRPGSVYHFENWEDVSSIYERMDSHGLLPADIIEWSRALTGLPVELIVFGVEPANLDFGSQISSPVMLAVPSLVSEVIMEIDRILEKG